VAHLCAAWTPAGGRSAARSLAGELSRRVHALVDGVVDLRAHVEACIDFPEEEIDPADRAAQLDKLGALRVALDALIEEARQGTVLREGLTVVLAGPPNVGKSSLLNRLAGDDVAIVTPIAGTTRDYVRATVSLEGVPIHLIDTAGLREARDEVERVGIERTWRAIEGAGAALLISSRELADDAASRQVLDRLPRGLPVARVQNKIDLTGERAGVDESAGGVSIRVSAKTGAGMQELRGWLLDTAGWKPHGEGLFVARERHLTALHEAKARLQAATHASQPLELMAEEIRLAQVALAGITGEVTADDLLGEIFSRFCIGK
jgi:tRNA modification GTPase